MFVYSKKKYILLFWFLVLPFSILQADESGNALFEKGKVYYSNAKYLEALYFFNEIINEEYNDYLADAYFWSAKSYLAVNEIDNAVINLEHFLLNYPRNPNYNEGFYYKGRILFMQNEFEKSLELFNRFIRSNPFSPFVSNAYYWIGECLYHTGNFDEALKVYKKVVEEYPSSFKLEASQYKISLIDYRFREEELLRLIRWSHEESLRTIEDYRNREKNYLQTISAYQQRIIEMENGKPGMSPETVNRLNDAVLKLENYLNELKNVESGGSVDEKTE
jgi:TolA-binding protein